MYKFIINKSEKYYNLVGDCKRDCNIFNLWFDILKENGLSFMEKTANRLIPESMFSVLEKTANRLEKMANCLILESMFFVLEKTTNRLDKTANC